MWDEPQVRKEQGEQVSAPALPRGAITILELRAGLLSHAPEWGVLTEILIFMSNYFSIYYISLK